MQYHQGINTHQLFFIQKEHFFYAEYVRILLVLGEHHKIKTNIIYYLLPNPSTLKLSNQK